MSPLSPPATIPGSLRPPSWSSDRHHPDHQSLISIAAIILASTPLRTWGYMVVRGNQNNPLFAQSLNWEYWCWMSSDIFLYLLCSPVRVTPCHMSWSLGGGLWWVRGRWHRWWGLMRADQTWPQLNTRKWKSFEQNWCKKDIQSPQQQLSLYTYAAL